MTGEGTFRAWLQVEVPDELYEEYRAGAVTSGDLLGDVARTELRRRIALDEVEAYLAELVDEVGEPAADETVIAEAIARRIAARESNPVR